MAVILLTDEEDTWGNINVAQMMDGENKLERTCEKQQTFSEKMLSSITWLMIVFCVSKPGTLRGLFWKSVSRH